MNTQILLLFAGIIISNILLNRATQKLSASEQEALQSLSKYGNIMMYIFSLIIVVGALININYGLYTWFPIIVFIGIIGITIERFVRFRQLKQQNFPAFYLRTLLLSALIQFACFLLMGIWVFYFLK